MDTEWLWEYEDIWPSWLPNALGKVLSLLVDGVQISKLDDTHLRVVAGANTAAAVIAIRGRWRFVEATITRAHPGGAAGTYDVYAVTSENDIESTPRPFTDDTAYGWDLRIVAAGATPPLSAGVVDLFRKIGYCLWDGTRITSVKQTVGVVQRPRRDPHSFSFGSDQFLPAAGTILGGIVIPNGPDESRTLTEAWVCSLTTGSVRPSIAMQVFRPADSGLVAIPGLDAMAAYSIQERHPQRFAPTNGPLLLPVGTLLVATVVSQGDYEGVIGTAVLETLT